MHCVTDLRSIYAKYFLGGQWLNRQGRVPQTETSDWEISADLPGKKEARKKGVKIEKKRSKIVKGKGGKLKMEGGKVTKWGEVFCLFVCLFVFFFAYHFSKPLNFVLGLPKWKFSTGKKHFTPGKKSGKITSPPQKKFSSYAGGGGVIYLYVLGGVICHYICDLLTLIWIFI